MSSRGTERKRLTLAVMTALQAHTLPTIPPAGRAATLMTAPALTARGAPQCLSGVPHLATPAAPSLLLLLLLVLRLRSWRPSRLRRQTWPLLLAACRPPAPQTQGHHG